ncbi:MAG: hypothetical protein VB089_06085 [Anaerolineaceae bacterium]|nr:hypothetical protein [Anaerolineaceae bacterium]
MEATGDKSPAPWLSEPGQRSPGPQGEEHRATLAGSGAVNAAGEFEIYAITAGTGNGWEFSAAALQESLSLWDGAECFIDHDWYGHSLHDLAGVCYAPEWDPDQAGIKAKLKALGPGGPLLTELGRQILAEAGPRPNVGFSADVLFTAQGRQVHKILRVFSVDLVLDPARGGAFLRALNSTLTQEQTRMTTPTQAEQPLSNSIEARLEADRQAVRGMLEEQARQQALAEEAEKARQVRAEMCTYLLDSALNRARLPAPEAGRIRQQFAGRVFEPAELQTAIEDQRQLVSELTGSLVVQGPGRVENMFSSEDQVTAAVHDLLSVDRPQGLEQLHPHRLSGIRELYTLMTGDYDFVGGYNPQRAQFATTADLPGILKNALNKVIINTWQELGRSGYRWWEPVVSVQHFNSLQSITGVLVGELSLLPPVNEGAAYTELDVSDSPETAAWGKYGGYVGLTLEMFERDETHKLRQYPQKLASAALRRISNLVAQVFLANAGVGPAMADSYNVFDASHHANLGTTALGSAAWEAASAAIYGQPLVVASGGTAPRLALDAKYLLVPRALRLTAQRILYPSYEREANIHSENMQRGEMGDVITVPDFSDAADWAAVADPGLAPAIILAERFGVLPEIFIADSERGGALFTNDEIRMKVRHWVSVFVADYRPLFKANVAA